jgi:5-methylcytosine-specific restriction endonuclease McrA
MRDKERNQAKIDARVGRNQYLCAQCKLIVGSKVVKVDHIDPVTPVTGWVSLDDFVTRLRTGKLQILCKTCHDKKSKEENEIRRTSKKNAKKRKKAHK